MAVVVFTVDSVTRTGAEPGVSNEEICEQAGSWRSTGLRFKFHPSDQGFFPNDPAAYPLYEVITEAGLDGGAVAASG